MRYLVFSALAALFSLAPALAQSPTPLPPDQVPPGVTAATAQYVANQGYAYGGDCQQTTPDQVGTACSLTYAQDDGTWLVTLSAVNPDGMASMPPYDQLTVTPDQAASALAAPSPVASASVASPSPAASASVASPSPAASASVASPSPAASASVASASTGIVAPLQASVALSTGTCRGGTVGITVTVTDGAGNPVAGATVSGYVQYRTTGHSFAFPPTNSAGQTSTSVNTGRPRGGYTVVWTVTATAGGLSATATATCYAP